MKNRNIVKIQLVNAVYRRVEQKQQHKIIHLATARWMKLLEKNAQLVQFRNFSFDDIMVFKIKKVEKTAGRNVEIILNLGERVL